MLIGKAEEIKEYLRENGFYSKEIEKFFNSLESENWTDDSVMKNLVLSFQNRTSIMAYAVIMDFFLDNYIPKPEEADNFIDIASQEINTILNINPRLQTGARIDEAVNLAFLLVRVGKHASVAGRKKTIESVKLMLQQDIAPVVKSDLEKNIPPFLADVN